MADAVLLIRSAVPSQEEGTALQDLRNKHGKVRVVRVRHGHEEYLEPDPLAYSFYKVLVEPYGDAGKLIGSEEVVKKPQAPDLDPADTLELSLPDGMKITQNGPWFSLWDNDIEVVKAIGRAKATKAMLEYLNGRMG